MDNSSTHKEPPVVVGVTTDLEPIARKFSVYALESSCRSKIFNLENFTKINKTNAQRATSY